MTFEELLRHKFLALPIIRKSEYFLDDFSKPLNEFNNLVKALDETDIVIKDGEFTQQPYAIKGFINNFIQGLIETVEIYLNGNPHAAFERFKKTIDDWDNYNLKTILYSADSDFYRIRLSDVNYLFPKEDMFHIPFHLRHLVSSQRFSIPGFPSLYLGRTIYSCWEEMERPNLSSFQAVRLNNTDELFCLDLVPPILKEEISGEDYRYFMTWPLIAACSIKVKHRNAPFKPEYIIPQLLLEWVRQEPTVHGIRYNSIQATHQQNSVLEGDFSNLVIPVKENAKSGYCTQLIKLFRISEPVSWEMEQVNSGGMTFISSEKENEIYNRKIPYLELVKGKKTPYAYTALADIEKSLSSMKLDFII